MAKKDNSTWRHKVRLRRELIETVADPVVMETHGGWGKLYKEVWYRAGRGIVLEKNEEKAEVLSRQRPTWAVYCADSEKAIAGGVGAHLPCNIFDVDPYGSPFATIQAILKSERKLPDTVHLVVNDGLRQKVQLGGAYHVECLKGIVADYGNDLYGVYLDVAKEMVRRIAKTAGFSLAAWRGYYCGFGHNMTHYHALLNRVSGAVERASD